MNITAFRAATVRRKRHVQIAGFEDEWVAINSFEAERLFHAAKSNGLDVHVEHQVHKTYGDAQAYITFNPRETGT
ncbi:MAG: hypothetical protein OXC08_20745 [Thiotrichales bacterium]|nr:hypothetical protein [Thiotrichales bacterium]